MSCNVCWELKLDYVMQRPSEAADSLLVYHENPHHHHPTPFKNLTERILTRHWIHPEPPGSSSHSSINFNIILPSTFTPSRWCFSSDCSTKISYTFLISPCVLHSPWFYHLIVLNEEWNSWNLLLRCCLSYCYFRLGHSTLSSNTPILLSSFNIRLT
jgi:hypothetical protein